MKCLNLIVTTLLMRFGVISLGEERNVNLCKQMSRLSIQHLNKYSNKYAHIHEGGTSPKKLRQNSTFTPRGARIF